MDKIEIKRNTDHSLKNSAERDRLTGWRETEVLLDETDGGDRELLIAGGEMDKSLG